MSVFQGTLISPRCQISGTGLGTDSDDDNREARRFRHVYDF